MRKIKSCPACQEMEKFGLTYEETHSSLVPGKIAVEGAVFGMAYIDNPHLKNRRLHNYTVYLLAPYCTWGNVVASSKKEAIAKCSIPEECNACEPWRFVALEED